MYNTEYGFGTQLEGRFDDIVAQTIEALSDQGFGMTVTKHRQEEK